MMRTYMIGIIVRNSLSVALNLLTLGGFLLGVATTAAGIYAGIPGLRPFGVGLLGLVALVSLLRLLVRASRKNSSR